MVREIFVKQLDGCTYVPGGKNCTCAAHAMWLFRASQGRITRTSCSVRRQTNDTVGGTSLRQMKTVSDQQGIPGGVLWLPGRFDKLVELVRTGRYAAHVNVGYGVLAGTRWDCFEGAFRGAHDTFLSVGDSDSGRLGDPGADARRAGIPKGYQDIPWDLLERAAGALPLVAGGPTLAQEHGSGSVYAYLTPADPIVVLRKYRVAIRGNTTTKRTPLYSAPNGTRVGAVSVASYVVTQSKVGGLWWYRIVSAGNGGPTANVGRYFKPTSWMTWEAL